MKFKTTGLVIVVVVAVSATAFFGCVSTEPGPMVTMEPALYVCDLAETFPNDTLEGFHLKNLADIPVGVVIEEIIVSEEPNGADGIMIWDFEDPEGGEHYWGFGPDTAGMVEGGAWTSGEIPPALPGEEVYISGNASPAYGAGRFLFFRMRNLNEEFRADPIMFVPIFLGDNVAIDQQRPLNEMFHRID